MYHYNFTNDLRISNLDNTLKEAATAFLTDTVPSATIDKSKNNNFMTVGFYFNLKAKGNCAKLTADGNIKKVVLNFIKKFQFPNVRTTSDYENAISDNIRLAPMREIVKFLNALSLIDRTEAYLTKDEIQNFIFFNNSVAKSKNPNIIEASLQIIKYRKDKILPQNIDVNESEHFWNQPDRQIREMIKTLKYTGCFSDVDENTIKFDVRNISRDSKADLFEIINFDSYWTGETVEEWQKYMDDGLDIKTNTNFCTAISPLSPLPSPPTQTIFYGVPGSGKSHKIDEETKDLPDEQKMRVVFHPEYTNADFVGQILPSNADGTISYKFKPGPFTKILRRAYLNPSKKYCLIIEEINRGNAAAIFGDVFQLLDRITDGKGEASGGYSYGNGWSRYSIENEFMNWYIRENLYADTNHKLQNEDDGIATKSADESQKAIEIGELHFSALTGIRLPPNLSLYATMNTSDQNVFTLDNAFQRRWDMKLVENKFEGEDAEKQRNAKIGGTDVSWGIFQTHINKKIGEISSSVGMSSMEDKRLGCWFVKAELNENGSAISKEKFAEKVLKYLWDDAFKFNREEVFDLKDKTQSLERIVQDFKADESGPCDWSIFKDTSFVQLVN